MKSWESLLGLLKIFLHPFMCTTQNSIEDLVQVVQVFINTLFSLSVLMTVHLFLL